MRLTIMPEDIRTDKDGTTITVSCVLPWGRLEARSAHHGTALLALWETIRKDCDSLNVELIWRAVKTRVLVVKAELLQVLRNERGEPVMADLVILEKLRGGSIPVEQLSAPRLQIVGRVGEGYQLSLIHI